MSNANQIKSMFDFISSGYDFFNDVISLGIHRIIKRRLIDICIKNCNNKADIKLIDVCTGTGDLAFLANEKKEVSEILGVDFSEKMLKIANDRFLKQKNQNKIKFLQADTCNLPLGDNYFDVCLMSFGLRNIPDKKRAVSECCRILKRGGRFYHLDFKNPNSFVNDIFNFLVPVVVRVFGGDEKSYRYLIDSKKGFLREKELIELFKDNGFLFKKEYHDIFSMISITEFCKK